MLKTVIATIALTVCTASLANADSGPEPTSKTTADQSAFKVVKIQRLDWLNVRSGPSTRFGIIGRFEFDTRGIAITGACKAGWCPVQHDKVSGWAFRGYLDKEEPIVAGTAAPAPVASVAPQAPAAKQAAVTPPAPAKNPPAAETKGVAATAALQPTAPAANPAAPEKPKSLPEIAFLYFVSQGWTEHQAAGIVGNLQAECGYALNCSIHTGGIAQWRAERVTRFRHVFGYPFHKASFKDQLAYIQWELTHPNSPWKDSGRILKRASDAASAASLFDMHYERSSGETRGARISNARSILKRYAGRS